MINHTVVGNVVDKGRALIGAFVCACVISLVVCAVRWVL